jgi:hypothetical protein
VGRVLDTREEKPAIPLYSSPQNPHISRAHIRILFETAFCIFFPSRPLRVSDEHVHCDSIALSK